MNKTTCAFAFIFGAAIGAAASWFVAKKYYEQIAQEEIDSVKEVFSRSAKEETPEEKPETPIHSVIEEKEDILDYARKVGNLGYHEYSKKESEEKGERPYVIPPDEFGMKEDEGYGQVSLMYYADHILADDRDQLVENVEEIIGFESLNHFGEYEADAVHVRNDVRKCDYEILRSLRTYAEVIRENPYKAEV